MKLKPLIYCLSALTASLCSCSNDDLPEIDSRGNTLHLTVTLSSLYNGSLHESRAVNWYPDRENGVSNEDVIHDALLIIYSTSLRNSALDNAEKPVAVYRVNCSATGRTTSITLNGSSYTLPVYSTSSFESRLEAGTYRVLAIANADQSLQPSDFLDMPLANLKDYVYTYPVCVGGANIKACDRFVMCSDAEREFTVTESDIANNANVSISGSTPILVERLAARIDVSFGLPDAYRIFRDASTNSITFNNGQPSATVNTIELPVYDYDSYVKGSLLHTGNTFILKDINVLNANNAKMFLIQRNGGSASNLFSGEAWVTSDGGTYSKYTIRQPGGVTFINEDHSLGALINANNNLYTADGVPYYTIGYYRENTTGQDGNSAPTAGKTTLQIIGDYHAVGTLQQTSADYNNLEIDMVMRHCHPIGPVNSAGTMAYAVSRNTIYRVRIDKILADADKVYVRWYYDSNNDGTYDPVTGVDGTAILRLIQETDGTSPND